jgi:hypothetical protein
MKTNLQKLIEATQSLDRRNRERFEDYFIGTLSVWVPAEAWERALAAAQDRVARIAAAAQKEVSRG